MTYAAYLVTSHEDVTTISHWHHLVSWPEKSSLASFQPVLNWPTVFGNGLGKVIPHGKLPISMAEELIYKYYLWEKWQYSYYIICCTMVLPGLKTGCKITFAKTLQWTWGRRPQLLCLKIDNSLKTNDRTVPKASSFVLDARRTSSDLKMEGEDKWCHWEDRTAWCIFDLWLWN